MGNIDEHLDFIVPKVIPFGEDLAEDKFWVGKRWVEVRDDEGFHESILHLFNEGGEYMLSLDGNIVRGTWKKLGQYNTLILELSGRSELFDLRFLSADFMVLTKHGDQARKGLRTLFLPHPRTCVEKRWSCLGLASCDGKNVQHLAQQQPKPLGMVPFYHPVGFGYLPLF